MRTGLKRFLSKRTPPFDRILFIESGSRAVLESWLTWLKANHPKASVDIFTCFEGVPSNFDASRGKIFLTYDYRTPEARAALVEELSRNQYNIAAVLCSGEPIMTKWKWFLAWKSRAKVLIVNENGDSFWADRGHWSTIRHFIAFRAGLSGSGALTQPLQLLIFPFTLIYLLAYASLIHVRRRFH